MLTQDYNLFWQKAHSSARKRAIPFRAMFELTYRCNFYCKHCYIPASYRDKGELKIKDVFSIIDQLKDIGCFYLGFTGGEPFVREDIMDILWYAKRSGFEVIIYSNGSLIDEKIAEELADLRPNKVDITIPAISEGAFEKITGVSGFRDKVFSAIELLHKKGVNLGFKSCLFKENQDEIAEIQRLADSLGALHRLDNMFSRRLDGCGEPYRYRALRVTGCTSQAGRGIQKDDVESLFYCGVGQSQAAVTALGELKMCLMIDYPRYKIETSRITRRKLQVVGNTSHAARYTLKQAWEKMKEDAASIKVDDNYKCNSCDLEMYCKWCPGKAWLYNRTWTSCDPEIKKWMRSVAGNR